MDPPSFGRYIQWKFGFKTKYQCFLRRKSEVKEDFISLWERELHEKFASGLIRDQQVMMICRLLRHDYLERQSLTEQCERVLGPDYQEHRETFPKVVEEMQRKILEQGVKIVKLPSVTR